MIYKLTEWQFALQMLGNILVVIGLFAFARNLFKILRRKNVPQKTEWYIAVGALAVGIVIQIFLLKFGKPHNLSTSDEFINSPQHFRKNNNPRLDLKAPEGWRIEYKVNEAKQKAEVHVLNSNSNGDRLVIGRYFIDNFSNLNDLTNQTLQTMSQFGLKKKGDFFSDIIADKPARGFIVKRDDGTKIANWAVEIHRNDVAYLQCFALSGQDPRLACHAPLTSIIWDW